MNIETIALSGGGRKTTSDQPLAVGRPHVPGYEILDELGRGGMGVVYLAHQTALNRTVALKMVIDGVRIHDSDRLRFLAEAEAVAAIKHPNVVQVYEYGQTRGLPYFAMEFVEGGSLSRALLEFGPMPPTAAAQLVAQVARGVQAAHDIGVVHRDLKPANILLQGAKCEGKGTRIQHTSHSLSPIPAPKVTDFGIAKRGDGVDLTMTGMVMGTPAYMAPEQAAGKAKFVGPGADIYALGVILFECLAGRTPFTAEDSQSLLIQVVQEEAPPVRTIVPEVPCDLELICAKCLAKTPLERYPSAAALAADLDRFAAGEPVSVRPPGQLEKAVRWVRKYPTWAAVYGLILLVAALGGLAGGAISLWHGSEKARTQAEVAKADAEDAREATQLALEREKQARLGEANAQRALVVVNAARDTDLAYREYEANNIDYARNLLDRVSSDLRTWEWNYVARVARRDVWVGTDSGGKLAGLGFAADTGELITGGTGGLRRWDAKTGLSKQLIAEPVHCLAVSGNGKRVVIGVEKRTIILELPSGNQLKEIAAPSFGLAFDYSGRMLLRVLRGEIIISDLVEERDVLVPCQPTPSQRAAIDPHGFAFAIGNMTPEGGRPAGHVQLFGAGGEALLSRFLVGSKSATAISFCPTRPLMAAGSEDGEMIVFDMTSGRPLSPGIFQVGRINAMTFSRDGEWLATAGEDRVVRVWHLHKHGSTEIFTFKGHSGPVTDLAFNPTGTHLVSTSIDGTVRFWEVTRLPDAIRLETDSSVTAIAALPQNNQIVASTAIHSCGVYDLRIGRLLDSSQESAGVTRWIQLNPANTRATLYNESHSVREFPIAPKVGSPIDGAELSVEVVAGSSDGQRLVSRGANGSVTVSDGMGKAICTTQPHAGVPHWTAISWDGKWVVTGGYDRVARVWDADTGNEIVTLIGHNSDVKAAAVSPDRARIATASRDGMVKVWDAKTGQVRLSFPSAHADVEALSWTPDGNKLFAANLNGIVQIFDGTPIPNKP